MTTSIIPHPDFPRIPRNRRLQPHVVTTKYRTCAAWQVNHKPRLESQENSHQYKGNPFDDGKFTIPVEPDITAISSALALTLVKLEWRTLPPALEVVYQRMWRRAAWSILIHGAF